MIVLLYSPLFGLDSPSSLYLYPEVMHTVPSESVKDNRVVTVNGIGVVWWQANIA